LIKEKIVLASGNLDKVREINALLSNTSYEIVPQSKFNVVEADETGTTFLENALIKARNAAQHTKYPVIADDSGIEVDALNGKPGIFSSRYAGPNASDRDNLNKLIKNIKGLDPKDCHARFICSMVFLENMNEKDPIVVEGVWEGYVVANPRGKNGFGYDPIFYIPSLSCTSAELSDDKKNELSHRGQALRLLIKKITGK
jgi:XTP/dITP diphosphohydrolase